MMDGLPKYTIKDLMDHGVHFGHQRIRWNPRMKPFIYDTRAGISIIDLRKTLPMLYSAMSKIAEVAANNGRILFVSTKEYMSDYVKQTVQDCAQFYVNYRWLGGTLTNWNTIVKSIDKMRDIREQLNSKTDDMTKKERGLMEIKLHKLERFLLGIENMKYTPDLLVVLDVYKDYIVVQEAIKKNIPIVAIVDTNGNPTGIQYPIPGNDDSRNTVKFYLDCFRDSVLHGIKVHLDKTAVLPDDKNDDTSDSVSQASSNLNSNTETEKIDTISKSATDPNTITDLDNRGNQTITDRDNQKVSDATQSDVDSDDKKTVVFETSQSTTVNKLEIDPKEQKSNTDNISTKHNEKEEHNGKDSI